MIADVHDLARTALYQATVAVGILLLPVALLARRVGVTLPLHRVLERFDRLRQTRG